MKQTLHHMRHIILKSLLLIFVFVHMPSDKYLSAEEGIPPNARMESRYQPGIGEALGQIVLAEGECVIVHSDSDAMYPARPGLPIYKDDSIITGKKGTAGLEMKDGSRLSLGAATKLIINRSIYDAESRNRSSFFSMLMGKIRFRVPKMPGFIRSDFKVKSKTAVVGVRGSDFVIEAGEEFTIITTLADTRLEVVSLFARCEQFEGVVSCQAEQYVLDAFEQVLVEKHDRVLESSPLGSKDRENLENAFPPLPDAGPMEKTLMIIRTEERIADQEVPENFYDEIRENMQGIRENRERELPDYPGEPGLW